MLAYKFTEKDLYSRRFALNKLKFLQELFLSTSPGEYPGPMQTSKVEKFAIIVGGCLLSQQSSPS